MLVVVGVEINEHINEIFKRGNNNREKLRMTSQCLPWATVYNGAI